MVFFYSQVFARLFHGGNMSVKRQFIFSLAFLLTLTSCVSSRRDKDDDKAPTPVKEPISDVVPIEDNDDNDDTTDPVVVTPLPIENENGPRIVVISDLNGSYGSTKYDARITKAIGKIIEIKPDLVLVTGDMVAGQKAGLNYKGMWEAFEKVVTIPLSHHNIPVFVTPGNHDASAYKGYEGERKIYKEVWAKYQQNFLNNSGVSFVSMDNYPFYYSFKVDNSLFISLDATTTNQITGTQRTWLLEQVSASNEEIKHKVIFTHMPMHPVAQNRENDYIRDPSNELFKQLKTAGVNLFLSGHHHAYYPGVYDGVRMLSQSCLGSGPRKLIGGNAAAEYSFSMVDFEEKIKVDAYKSPDYKTPVSRQNLVKSIKSPKGGQLERDDIVFKTDFSIGDI